LKRALLFALFLFIGLIRKSAPFQILYTNDLHLRFARMASLAALIESAREEEYPTILLSMRGTPGRTFETRYTQSGGQGDGGMGESPRL